MKPDAIRRLKAGCPLRVLGEFHNTDEGFRHNNKEGGGGWVGGQEAVGVKIGASVDSANNIPTLGRD